VTSEEPIDNTIDLTADYSSTRSLPVNGNGSSNGNQSSNGHGSANGRGSAPSAASVGHGELDGVQWFPAYDRATVERYLDSLDDERVRLEAEIADAERRTREAQQALAARTAEVEAALGAVVLAARAELDRIEREQDAAVAAIRAEAQAEASRIRDAARLEAAKVHDAASSLTTLSRHDTDVAVSPERPVTPPPHGTTTNHGGWTDAG
jgi:hypothetical protein